jgi:hypothetical protein
MTTVFDKNSHRQITYRLRSCLYKNNIEAFLKSTKYKISKKENHCGGKKKHFLEQLIYALEKPKFGRLSLLAT